MGGSTLYQKRLTELDHLLRPSDMHSKWMLQSILRIYGFTRTLEVCGMTPANWVATVERGFFRAGQRRAIFYAYAITLAPHLIRSRFDMLTWGRFAIEPVKEPGIVRTEDHYEI